MWLSFKLAIGFILLVIIYFVTMFAGDEYLSLYWHSDVVQLYQDDDGFWVCGKSKSYFPVWDPNESYAYYSPKMESAVSSGYPITIVARVLFTEDNQEVQIVNIKGFKKGENKSCKI